jgi:tRNA G37 N-methylase Trm5
MPKHSICVKTSKKRGQIIINLVSKLELIDKSLKIQHIEENICIPIARQPQENELAILKNQVPEMQLSTLLFTEKQLPKENLIQLLENKLPPHSLASLPKSLDVIGDIAIIDIPLELKPHENHRRGDSTSA